MGQLILIPFGKEESWLPSSRTTYFIFPNGNKITWLREPDLNRQPSGYEPDELPTAPSRVIMVEGEGFEPSKASPTDLQSAPFGRLGIPPGILVFSFGAEHRT